MMEKEEFLKLREEGRNIIKGVNKKHLYPEYKSDQELKNPQPPLVKAPMRDTAISLPVNFEELHAEMNLLDMVNLRKSHRVYTQENISLLQLSYMLWVTQGIKDIRGKSYATIRTVPCGGARHPFETYLFVNHVEGLERGLYHYLPMGHKLEYLGKEEDSDKISASLCEQVWATKASVIFYWSIVPYRVEWRYGIFFHYKSMIDIGHVGENLYLACTALGLGTCGIAAYDQNVCDEMFELDGEDEFIIYTEPVGTISTENEKEEKDFYRFVIDQGL